MELRESLKNDNDRFPLRAGLRNTMTSTKMEKWR